MKLLARNIRTFVGREGPGYNASLYVDGVKAADAIDEGNGGCGYQYFQDRELEKRVHAAAENAPKSLVPFEFEHLDQILDKLIENAQNNKRFKKLCSKHVVFRLKSHPPAEFASLNVPITRPKIREVLQARYNDDLEYILNDKLDEVFPLELELVEAEEAAAV